MATVTITINGQKHTVPKGITVLEAAREAGIDIPTLCEHPALSSVGSCRLCVVEIQGQRNLQSSCTFPVADGMEIQTDSPKVEKSRLMVLKILFSERNHFCPFCELSGNCELQNLGYRFGLDHWLFPTYLKNFPLDASHAHYLMDHNRCVLCGRCIRACAELAANHTLGLGQRGSESLIIADINAPLGQSSCVSCGTCVQVCPTGALFFKRSAYMGFNDIERAKSTCTWCSMGCAIEIETRGENVLQVKGDWDGPPNGGVLCKAGRFDPFYDGRERLLYPVMKNPKGIEKLDWDGALGVLASKIRETPPGEIGIIVSSRASNEALYLVKKIFSEGLNVSNIKLASGAGGHIIDRPHGSFADLAAGDMILLVGADPAVRQPVASFMIKRAVDKGIPLVVVDDNQNGLAARARTVLKTDDMESAAGMLSGARRPVIVYGPGGINGKTAAMLQGVGTDATFIALEEGVNTRAARAFGMNGNFDPSAVSLLLLFIGEEDRRPEEVLQGIAGSAFVVIQASYSSDLAQRADLLLPEATWPERTGSLTNTEGRLRELNRAVSPSGEAKSDWEILEMLAKRMGNDVPFSPGTLSEELARILTGKERA